MQLKGKGMEQQTCPMIEVRGLVKRFGAVEAVRGISFTVGEGEIVGFLGPNGAGKSTTMNILTGYISATEGSVSIGGHDILKQPNEAKRLLGFLPEQPPLYMEMTVEEYLRFVCKIKRTSPPYEPQIALACEKVGLSAMRHRMIRNLSKGYRQRTGIAQALIGEPRVVILDEPTVGLDPIQIVEIRSVIRDLKESCTVILSSHILPEIQAVCERVLMINEGKIVADGTVQSLSGTLTGHSAVVVRAVGDPKVVLPCLNAARGVCSVTQLPTGEEGACDYLVQAHPNTDIRGDVFTALASNGLTALTLKPSGEELEDLFLRLTTKEELT